MTEASREAIRTGLLAEAHRRFGEERAEALAPELATLADDLARIASAVLPVEGEPGFFLVSE